jgi:hypothetical protein
MNVEIKVNADDVSRTFRVLRKIEPDLVKELRQELQSDLKPTAKAIAAKYPTQPTLSGFEQTYGRWGWDKVTGTVKITPGKTRKGAGRTNLVSLSMNFKSATPFVLDMIGRKKDKLGNYSSNRYLAPYGQGPALYNAIQRRFPSWPNGGRIFYKEFLESRSSVTSAAVSTINRWTNKVNKELN